MKITLLAFGQLKTPGSRELYTHYEERMSHWRSNFKYELVELKPVSPTSSDATAIDRALTEEARLVETALARLQPRVTASNSLWILDVTGKSTSTDAWVKLLEKTELETGAHLVLLIGSSFGVAESLKSQARGLISLSPGTFPHELARIVLVEQLVRAWSIRLKHPYHHG